MQKHPAGRKERPLSVLPINALYLCDCEGENWENQGLRFWSCISRQKKLNMQSQFISKVHKSD